VSRGLLKNRGAMGPAANSGKAESTGAQARVMANATTNAAEEQEKISMRYSPPETVNSIA